jgi:dipeptidyl aminopeptidase/acylaminoacyl peptidase
MNGAFALGRRVLLRYALTLVLGLWLSWRVSADPSQPAHDDGAILATHSCPPLRPHAELDAFGRAYFDEVTWEALRARTDLRCSEVRYRSAGHVVQAFVAQPVPRGADKLPAVIYARGGTGDFGRVDALLLAELRLLAASGFVVAVSNTRFVDALSREDPWGGADLDDVLALLPVLRSLPEVDARNLFMLGVSRGGMTTYLALKRGAPLRAAAVIGGVSDLTRMAVEAPEFVLGDADFAGWAALWPDYRSRSRELLEERSAVYWPERLGVPVLILHSRTDPMVPVRDALELGLALERAGRPYELVVYEQDGHGLPRHRSDRNRRISEFFQSHVVR